MKAIEKAWGRELVVANRSGFCGKVMILRAGWRCSLHYHPKKDETFLITKGRMIVEIGEPGAARRSTSTTTRVVYANEVVDVPPLTLHRFSAPSHDGCEFIEFSSKDDPADSVRIEPSGICPGAIA